MIYVLVAVMSLVQEDGFKNTYVWTTPRFNSLEQCQIYGHEYTAELPPHAGCVSRDIVDSPTLPTDKLEEFYSNNFKKPGEET